MDTTDNFYKIALKYIHNGFSVIPLQPKDKKPAIKSWKEFQNRKATEKELQVWFGNGNQHNLGIVTGAISGVVVVDFDSSEAVKFAQDNNFPPTPLAKTGKGFHAYYRYKDGVRNFQKRDNLPDIDLRGDGGYIVAPPSIHKSGHQYIWIKGRTLDDLPLAELPEIILAKWSSDKTPVNELLKNGVSEGQRNDSLARIAGALFERGLDYAEVFSLCLAWNKRNMPPLFEGEVKKSVESIFNTHQRNNPPKAVEVIEDAPEPQEKPLSFPDTAWRGVFDTYRQSMANTTWASDVTHFLTLWAVVSAKLKRRVRFPYGMDLYPNGYLIYFGDTGDKKTTATSKSTTLLADDPTIKILQGIGSGEGLTSWLESEDRTVNHFLYLSELSELLQKGKWDGATLKAVLTHIYDCPPVYEAPFRKNPIKIIEPTLTMLACTTPTWFWKDLTELDIHGGFANRILYLTGQPKEPIARPQKPDAMLLNKVRRHIEDAVKTLPAYTLELELDPQATKLWDEFYIEWVKEEWPPLVKEAVKRVDAYILKLAMVYCVLEGTTPHITYDQLASAIQVGYYSAKCTEKLITKHQWKSKTVKLEERIIEELKKRDCTRRQLQRTAGQNCESWLFNKAIDGMVKAEGIYEREGNRKGQYVYSLKYQ